MRITQLIELPEFLNPEQARQAHIVRNMQLIMLIAAGLLGAVSLAVSLPVGRLAAILLALTALLSMAFLRWGKLMAAGYTIILALTGAMVIDMTLGQGLHDMTIMALPLVLSLASLLMPYLHYWILAVAIAGVLELVVYLELTDILVTPTSHLAIRINLLTGPLMVLAAAWMVRWLADMVAASLRQADADAARQAALAEAAQQRVNFMEALNRVGTAVLSGLDLPQVLETLYRRVMELVPADAFYTALYDEETGYLTFPIFYDEDMPVHVDPNDVRKRPGLAGEVINRKRTLYIPDLQLPEILSTYSIVHVTGEVSHTYLGVPLMIQDRVIGIMSVQSTVADAFTKEMIAFVEALGTQTAIAIENARLYSEMQDSLVRELRLNQAAHIISRSLDLDEVMANLVRLTVELVEGDVGGLALVSPDGNAISNVHDYKIPGALFNRALPKGTGLTWEVIENRKTVRLDHYEQYPRALPELVEAGVHAMMVAPLLAQQGERGTMECLGVILVGRTDPVKLFNSRDQTSLESITIQAVAAIQNAQLVEALRQRETILEQATFAAEKFLSLSDWRQGIYDVLQRLSEVTHVDRLSLYENQTQASEPMITLRYTWPPIEAQGTPEPSTAEVGISQPLQRPGWKRWYSALHKGEPFQGSMRTVEPEQADEMDRIGVHSFLSVPVYIGNTWWGEFRLEDMHNDREWPAVEIDGIKIVAGVLGAAIQRQRSEHERRESEAIYRRTISAAGAVPYQSHYDSDKFVFIGEGIANLTGYPADEMDLNLWNSLVDDAVMLGDAAGLDVDAAWELASAGKLETWRCDYLIHTREGEQRWVSDTAVELIGPNGQSTGAMGIMMDITARKKAEEVVVQLNLELEQRVRERTAELEAANKELEAFAYSVAHDLRAPLRSIDGYSKLIQEDYAKLLDEDGQGYLENTRRAAQRMGQLIDDLLLLSRVTRQEMNRTLVNLSTLSEDVISGLQRSEPARSVKVIIEPNMYVQGDENLLRLVLENLIGNAWKFTSKQKNARIELGKMINTEGTVYFVRDNGAGFDMKYANQLFKAFHRLHTEMEFVGSGVGLATVQRVIQRHGGEIWAKGSVNQGATFYFTILR